MGGVWRPFIKRCTVSGFDYQLGLWILDGLNNAGFSGGPVTFRKNGLEHQIAAVISGYVQEPTDVILKKNPDTTSDSPRVQPEATPAQQVLLNSGLILAFDIRYAIEAATITPNRSFTVKEVKLSAHPFLITDLLRLCRFREQTDPKRNDPFYPATALAPSKIRGIYIVSSDPR